MSPPNKQEFIVGPNTWDVSRLWLLAKDLPSRTRPLSDFPEWSYVLWGTEGMTLRAFTEHMKRVQEADLSYPVILSAEGDLMDGAHRLVKAHLLGRETILVQQFEVTPEPDSQSSS